MSWQGANQARQRRKVSHESNETVEAGLYRLQQAYQASLQCIRTFQTQSSDTHARAARRVLEESILSDPWISSFTFHTQTTTQSVRHCLSLSKSHQATVQQLAYLGLVNYADLLLAGIPKHPSIDIPGIVQKCLHTVWNDDDTRSTERVALQAYLDAVALDASDPTVWLKLAATSRLLELWRLQKHALERSMTCHSLPNRTASAMYQRMQVHHPPIRSVPSSVSQEIPVVSLSRYSWSALTRLLLRHPAPTQPVRLSVSVLFVVPTPVWSHICGYLESNDLSRLQSTCRALSTTLLSVRIARKRQRQEALLLKQQTTAAATKTTAPTANTNESSDPPHEDAVVKRSSKRVKSQLETSEKRTERIKRKTSVSYCLIAACLGVTRTHPTFLELVQQEDSRHSPRSSPRAKRIAPSDTSLQQFVQQLDATTPRRALVALVAYVSRHIGDTQDSAGLLVLSKALMDALTYLQSELLDDAIGWCAHANICSWTERLALDVLDAELRLRRCEAWDVVDCGYTSDANVLATLIPSILSVLEKESMDPSLVARGYWVACGFYQWRSRLASTTTESREAEQLGLHYLERAEAAVESVILTPHLVSPTRKGLHWRELSKVSLSSFAAELQASSVVLLAQERFLEATSKLMRRNATMVDAEGATHTPAGPTADECRVLFVIGESLLKRYDTTVDSPDAKFVELIDDLLRTYETRPRVDLLEWLNDLWPEEETSPSGMIARVSATPCILVILVTCLRTNVEALGAVLQLLVRTAVATTRLTADGEQLYELDGGFDFDDDDVLTSQQVDVSKSEKLMVLVCWLLRQLRTLYSRDATEEQQREMYERGDFNELVQSCMNFCTDWLGQWKQSPRRLERNSRRRCDLALLHEVRALVQFLRDSKAIPHSPDAKLETVFVSGLVYLIPAQRRVLESICSVQRRGGRAERYHSSRARTELLAVACCELGRILSHNMVCAKEMRIQYAPLVSSGLDQSHSSTSRPVAVLCDTLLALWTAAFPSSDTPPHHKPILLDRHGRDRLRVPLAVALSGVCGSMVSTLPVSPDPTQRGVPKRSEVASLFEFYDSDSSALADCRSDSTTSGNEATEFLRVLSQASHCINQVLETVDEHELETFAHVDGYITPIGPLLPVLIVRVLNRFAGLLLTELGTQGSDPLWSDFSYSSRTTGELIDMLLRKVYKILYGFSVNPNDAARDSDYNKKYTPESTTAAADLYRCMMRTYAHGRKSPPKNAINLVIQSLPPLVDTERTQSIRKFLFSANPGRSKMDDITRVIDRRGSWTLDAFSSFPVDHHILDPESQNQSDHGDEVSRVRRGLSKLISEGTITAYQDPSSPSEARSTSIATEDDLSNRFNAIIETICFNGESNIVNWFNASQCLSMKADLIADRLGLTAGFSRSNNFRPTRQASSRKRPLLSRDDLECEQKSFCQAEESDKVFSLGSDLSLFINHSWTSPEQLEKCADEVLELYRSGDARDTLGQAALEKLESLRKKSSRADWQCAWGGIFVSSLRKVALRCLMVALRLSFQEQEEKLCPAEFLESLGLMFYSDLASSQDYGFPMTILPPYRKRQFALAAMACFERSIEASLSSNREKNADPRAIWDVLFMIGKCQEKVATSYVGERYSTAGGEPPCRQYELWSKKALQSYASSLGQAIEYKKGGGFIPDDTGGSSHGVLEVVYRLHASRLKCLIAGVHYSDNEHKDAQMEALRLVEKHWYGDEPETDKHMSARERLWRALADIVDGIVSCRTSGNHFHRSVYRHAQALMWAPILFDPEKNQAIGSLGNIPEEAASRIKGLTSTGAQSACEALSALCGKKRSQLAAVWVTSDNPITTIQTINSSTRKYDSLRGKYVGAYVEALQVCKMRKELDTFLRWTMGCQRDLPSCFYFSADPGSDLTTAPHTNDRLVSVRSSLSSRFFLVTVKRQANSALASLLNDSSTTKSQDDTSKCQKQLEDEFKIAYACFLRLKCEPDEMVKKCGKFCLRAENGAKDVVLALTAAFLELFPDHSQSLAGQVDWSGKSQLAQLLRSALSAAKSKFPHLSSTFSFAKTKVPRAKGKTATEEADEREESDTVPKTVKKTFEVPIPAGLGPGESFTTSISLGDDVKKFRLTVPTEPASTLRFSLDVPLTGTEADAS